VLQHLITLFELAIHKAQLCPPEINPFAIALDKMPLKTDEEEAKKVHEKLVKQVMGQNAGLIGQNNANLGKILSILAEIYGQEDQSTKENDEEIKKIFTMLPRDVLMACAAKFTEKQQKRIEKMIAHGG